MKAEDKYQQKQRKSLPLVEFAKEMALLTSKAIFQNIHNNKEQSNSQLVIEEETEEQPNEIKSSFLGNNNNEDNNEVSTFQSQLLNISLNQKEQIKKETKITSINSTTPSITTFQNEKKQNTEEFIQNKISPFLNRELSDVDSSDESGTCEELTESDRWPDEYTLNRTDRSNNSCFKKGKLTLYEKSKRDINYRNAKINEERNKKLERMTTQIHNIPEITDKSKRIVEKMNNYVPLYLRASQLHLKKKAKGKLSEKRELNKDNNNGNDEARKQNIKKKIELKTLTKEVCDFIARQEKWSDNVIHKKKNLKLQQEHPKSENNLKPLTNQMSNAIIIKLTNENRNNNRDNNDNQLESVFNRLFIDKEQHDARQQYRDNKSKYSFKPQLNTYMPSYLKKKQSPAKSKISINDITQYEPMHSKPSSEAIPTELSLINFTIRNKQSKQNASLSLTKAVLHSQTKPTTQANFTTGIKSRNANKSTSKQSQAYIDNDEEYVIAQYKLAMKNQIDNSKFRSQKVSRTNTDNNTTTFSIYNYGLSKSKDDNTNFKSKKTLKRSISNITTVIGFPDLYKINMNIVEENNISEKHSKYGINHEVTNRQEWMNG